MATATANRIDADLDAQSPAADLVRVYLNGIGKTALLSAADEVELASPAVPALGQHLAPVEATQGEATGMASRYLAGLLLVALLAGAARQALGGAVRGGRPAFSGA